MYFEAKCEMQMAICEKFIKRLPVNIPYIMHILNSVGAFKVLYNYDSGGSTTNM